MNQQALRAALLAAVSQAITMAVSYGLVTKPQASQWTAICMAAINASFVLVHVKPHHPPVKPKPPGRVKRVVRKVLRKPPPTAVMYDSIEVGQIPANPPAVAGYVGGHWPTFQTLREAFPHAHALSIAVNAGEDADCLDVEAGDATPVQAAAWVVRQHQRGVRRPVIYASVSNVPAIMALLRRAGIPRTAVRVWSAHYTYRPHICGPACGLSFTADATQWTDRALHRNLDQSLLGGDFFA